MVWDFLIAPRRIQGYVSNITLDTIWFHAKCLEGRQVASQVIDRLLSVLECQEITQSMLDRARVLPLPFSAGLQVVCVEDWELDRILVLNSLEFQKVGLWDTIFTADQLIVDYLSHLLKDQRAILEERLKVTPFQLERIEIHCGDVCPKAIAIIRNSSGEFLQERALGNGPIDAACKAVERAIRRFTSMPDYRMIHYTVQSTREDSESSVMILLQSGDSLFPGRAFHTDTVLASAHAYLDAISHMLWFYSPQDNHNNHNNYYLD
ncbi:MAG: hypothetical protein HC769_20730 [Cyanobacteria bacterium CRU_2_1]|nr:hypothetical protein [Cyanobacteria bacterium RU_5_0]NJR61035.1 hypothetical protein [Cyanobacteria bacterium CRU_2_1]